MTALRGLVAYVDVDDTLVRSFGSKRIPMTEMVQYVRELNRDGVALARPSEHGSVGRIRSGRVLARNHPRPARDALAGSAPGPVRVCPASEIWYPRALSPGRHRA